MQEQHPSDSLTKSQEKSIKTFWTKEKKKGNIKQCHPAWVPSDKAPPFSQSSCREDLNFNLTEWVSLAQEQLVSFSFIRTPSNKIRQKSSKV